MYNIKYNSILTRLYYSIILIILFIGFVSAGETNEYQYFKYNEPSRFLTNCFLDELPCPDTINCSITIYTPAENTLINNVPIAYDGHIFYFDLNESDNSYIGTYQAVIYCNNGGTFIDKFVISYDVTGNGRPDPDGIVIVLFASIFIILSAFLLYITIYSLGHFIHLDFDLIDLAFNVGGYIGLLAVYMVHQYYLANPQMSNIFEWALYLGGLTNVLIPFIALIVSLIYQSIKKKNAWFGRTQ